MRVALVSLKALALAKAASISSPHFHVGIDDVTGAVIELKDSAVNGSMSWVGSPSNAPWQPLGSRWGLGYADLGGNMLHRSFWSSPKTSSHGAKAHASTYALGPLELTVSREIRDTGGVYSERYTFTNKGNDSLDLAGAGETSLAIYTPFNDHYTNTTDALQTRAHAHVWANGGSTAWVKMNQMGGHNRNLGLVLTEGSLAGYSIESRDPITMSNTRGVFLLHPAIPSLEPGQSSSVEWTLFWHSDWDDFFSQCAARSKQFINFDIPSYTQVTGQTVTINMTGAVNSGTTIDGSPVHCQDSVCIFDYSSDKLGEHALQVSTPSDNGALNSTIFLNTVPRTDDLISERIRFIIKNQQVSAPSQSTDGAYVVYDTEAQTQAFWETASDHSPGRERVGMGILMARWLKKHPKDEAVRASLKRYYSYVSLELQEEDGYVLNKPGKREFDSKRLYNWPWVLQLHVAVAALDLDLTGPVADKTPVERFMLTLENFYDEGGKSLYAIGLPVLEALRFFKDSGDEKSFGRTKSLFITHGEEIIRRGLDYPASEVNFEQSIVAPAAVMMAELYRFTGNKTWLEAAELQLETLLRFEGKQPDYHLHDVAIRHWDGYWFGKDRLWGDTFPHYWSTLDAIALHHYGKATGDDASKKRAAGIIKANLALFSPDGEAGCAWVYPLAVNGRDAHHRDPYANDQDWALNHLLYLEADDEYDTNSTGAMRH